MGQCPATRYVQPILEKIKNGEFDATDIITHILPLEKGSKAYEIFDKKEDNLLFTRLKTPFFGRTCADQKTPYRSRTVE